LRESLRHIHSNVWCYTAQRDAAKVDYEAKVESNTIVPLIYSVIMGDLVDQSRKAMENMSDEQKDQLQDMMKEDED